MAKTSYYSTTLYVELELSYDFTYRPATPDVMYLWNGDPGYPGDPEEIDTIKLEVVFMKDGEEHKFPIPDEWLPFLEPKLTEAVYEAVEGDAP